MGTHKRYKLYQNWAEESPLLAEKVDKYCIFGAGNGYTWSERNLLHKCWLPEKARSPYNLSTIMWTYESQILHYGGTSVPSIESNFTIHQMSRPADNLTIVIRVNTIPALLLLLQLAVISTLWDSVITLPRVGQFLPREAAMLALSWGS